MKNDMDRLWNVQECAEFLGIKVWTLRVWVSQRSIPFVKVGKKLVRFRPGEIAAWLETRSHKPRDL